MGHVPGVTNSRSCPSGSPSKRWCHDLITPLNPRPLVSPPDRTLTEMKGERTDQSWHWSRLTFCGLMFLTALRLVRLLRRRSLLYRWSGRRSLCNPGLRRRSMLDRRRWRFDFLLRRRGFPCRWLGGCGMYDPGLRRRSMVGLSRWRSDFLLRRRDLRSRRLGRRGMSNPGLRSRSMVGLWRWRSDFLLRRRARVHLGRRFSDGHRLAMGGRHRSRLWRGDFSGGCFYLGGRFRRCHVRRLMRRRRGRFWRFLVRRLMRRRVRVWRH